MRALRTRIVALTLLLLVQQTVALGLTTALACCAPEAAAAEGMECCETGEPGHMCPLTNRRAADAGCRIRSGCTPDDSGMLAGAGFLYAAPLVARFVLIEPSAAPGAPRLARITPALPSTSPPTPPPKA
jgi:hypothetical protein